MGVTLWKKSEGGMQCGTPHLEAVGCALGFSQCVGDKFRQESDLKIGRSINLVNSRYGADIDCHFCDYVRTSDAMAY